MMKIKPYPHKFKLETVKNFLEKNQNISKEKFCKKVGIKTYTIDRWVKKFSKQVKENLIKNNMNDSNITKVLMEIINEKIDECEEEVAYVEGNHENTFLNIIIYTHNKSMLFRFEYNNDSFNIPKIEQHEDLLIINKTSIYKDEKKGDVRTIINSKYIEYIDIYVQFPHYD